MQGERILSIDFVKAVAIIAMVLGHITSPFGHFIFSWHMPAFFFASGFLLWKRCLKDGPLPIFSKHDFLHLGRYYLIFGVLAITAEYIKVRALGRPPMDMAETAIGFIYFMDMSHLHHYGFILWFLPALFWAKLFMRILMRWTRKSAYMLAGAILLFLAGVQMPLDMPIGLGIHAGLLAVLWCVSGGLFCKALDQYQGLPYVRTIIFLGCLTAAVVFPAPQLDLASYQVPFPLYNVVYSLIIIYLLVFLGDALERKGTTLRGVVGFISRNSIYIMVFHVYTNNAAGILLKHYCYEVWWITFTFSCVLLIPVLLMIRFLQSKWGKRTGNTVE